MWTRIRVWTMTIAVAVGGRRQPGSVVHSPGVEPPAVQRLRADWESRPNRGRSKKDWGEAATAWSKEFRRELDDGHEAEIQTFVEAFGEEPPSDQVYPLIEGHLFRRLLEDGDRVRLLKLLSTVP